MSPLIRTRLRTPLMFGTYAAVAVVASIFHASRLPAATTIDVSNNIAVPAVKRFGINLGTNAYWDAQITKNLNFRNSGFEGLLYRSVIQCASGTPTTCIDTFPTSAWPTGFWNGASYEFIYGAAKGRAGTVMSSSAPSGGAGSSYVFADSGTPPANGDYFVLRKTVAGGADTGWVTDRTNGGTISTELSDLPPGTEGKQAIRLSSPAGGTAMITGPLDNVEGQTFLQLNGTFRLTFKAKGAGGNNALDISFRRSGSLPKTYIDQQLVLGSSWSPYSIDFIATESGTSIGSLDLQFAAAAPSTVLIDDVSLTQTNSDSANTTAFRDPVITALRTFRPGIIRYLFGQYGDSLDNNIAPPFGRLRTGYNINPTTNETDLEYGLHEFLELCNLVGAEPWFVFSVAYSNQEMTNLLEYLGGPATSTYGGKRAARGRASPWTDAFTRIHLEFGNEAWNPTFSGAAILDATAYGNRGSEIYGVARSSPYYSASKYDLVLGSHAEDPQRSTAIQAASVNHDSIALAPYLAVTVNDFANEEQLFGPLFAEPEMDETAGSMKQTSDVVLRSSRSVPMSVYEVNIDATEGSISQAALDSFTPSVGAGLAVAEHMLLMLRELAIRDQMLFALTQFSFRRADGKEDPVWGVTRDLGVTNRKRPQFLAVKLANDVLAGNLLRTTQSGDNPTWNQPPSNGVSLNNAHFIQSFAFANGDARAVIVFNLSRTTALDVRFTGPNAPPGTVTLQRLTAPAITDNNENSEKVIVTTTTLNNFNSSASLSLPRYSMSVLTWRQPTRRRRAARS